MRKAKILATLGPSTRDSQMIEAMLAAGINGVRINMSHGTPEEKAEDIRMARDAAQRMNRPLAVLVDLSMVKLLKVVAAIDCELVPLKLTVPVPGLKVPLLVQLPSTERAELLPFKLVLVWITTLFEMARAASTENVPPLVKRRFPLTTAELVRVPVPAGLSKERL